MPSLTTRAVIVACLACSLAVVSCRTKAGGSCVQNGDCASPLVCEEGRCAACPDTKGCQAHGLCEKPTLEGLRDCFASDDGCKVASACKTDGRCHAGGPNSSLCVAKGDDCADTKPCREWGRCAPNTDGTCSEGPSESCKASETCRSIGHCTLLNGHCAAGSDEDCKAPVACAAIGYCTAKDGNCVAGRDADCLPTQSCKVLGHCTAAGNVCVLAKSEDCQRTVGCETVGHCSMRGDRCVVGEDADCKRSAACTKEGRCRAKPPADAHDTKDQGTCIKG